MPSLRLNMGQDRRNFHTRWHKFKKWLVIDSNTYTIITDRVKKQVQIYRPDTNLLVKRMTGFGLPLDVGMGYKCGYLLVTDYYHGIYLL